MIKLAPSILASNLMHIEDEIRIFESMNVPYIHIDIMDGLFVNNFSFGTSAVKNIRKITDLVLDVHLMTYDPIKHIPAFCKCGADIVSFHLEATSKPDKAIDCIKEHGKKACITLKPTTEAEAVFPYLDRLDQVLIMGVMPGFGGQDLIVGTIDKIKKLRRYIKEHGYNIDIEIDGGVKESNIRRVLKAGANVIVAGSYIYKDYNIEENINRIYSVFKEFE